MTRWLVGTSIRLQYLVLVLAVVLVVFGISQVQAMPVDVFPEIDPPLVEVQTEALGLSGVETESLITAPLEATMLNGVAWLDSIESETLTGLSSITLVFEEGTDPIKARQMVQERLVNAYALPNISSPPVMINPLSSNSRVMLVSLASADISLIDLSVLARWTIVPRLLGVQGVANVSIWGQRDWQLQVQVDPERLNEQGVSILQVIESTGNAMWVSPLTFLRASSPGTSGWIDTPNQRLSIQHILPISSASEMGQIPVAGHPDLALADVAEIIEDHQPLIGDAAVANAAGLILVVEKFPSVSTMEVTEGVEKALADMAPGMTGITVDTSIFRPANTIQLAISNVSSLLMISAGLVVILLIAFYMGWRSVLVTAATVAVSLIVAVLVLHMRGATFNVMTLAGLALALCVIVDDSIVDVENIVRRLKQGRSDGAEPTLVEKITSAVLESRGPLWFAFLASVLLVLPAFFFGGLLGAFFQPFVMSYFIAIVTSLVVAATVTPALSVVILTNVEASSAEPALMQQLRNSYKGLLTSVLKSQNLALGATAVLVVLLVALVIPQRVALLPEFQSTELRIQWDGAPGTSREAMLRVTGLVSTELRAIAGVSNLGTHVGRAITGDQNVNLNHAEIWLTLAPSANYSQTVAQIEEVIQGYPGMFTTVESFKPERLGDVFDNTNDITVRVYGNEFNEISATADTVAQAITGVAGLENVQTNYLVEEPQLEIEVDLAKAEQYQISPGEIRRAAAILISGLTVGHLYEEQRVFEVVVWGIEDIRNSLSDIENLLIETPTGLVPLGDLADIRIAAAPAVIQRDAVKRYVDVHATINGRDFASVANDVQGIISGMAFPLEYHAEILDIAQTQNSLQTSILLLVTVIVGIFLLLQASFQSWRLALAASLSLPAALAGSALAMLLTGGVISLGSIFGMLAVVVLAVRNLLSTTNHLETLRSKEGASLGQELVLEGAQNRLGSVVMGSLSVILLALPFVFAGSKAGTEILHPMAVVIFGGLLTNIVLNLFLMPALYLRFAPKASAQATSPASQAAD